MLNIIDWLVGAALIIVTISTFLSSEAKQIKLIQKFDPKKSELGETICQQTETANLTKCFNNEKSWYVIN